MTRTTIPKPADRDAWLELRHPYVGASEVAALLGRHPYLSAGELAVRKLTRTTSEENKAMRRGRHLEAGVATMYAEDLGLALVEPEELYVYDDVLLATLDRLLVGTNDIVEIKTVRHHVGNLPEHWLDQAQVQLLCSGLDRVRFVVFDMASDDLDEHVVAVDVERQHELHDAAKKFVDAIRRGEMPADLQFSYDELAARHPTPTVDDVELDEAARHACACLLSVSTERRALEAEEERLKATIAAALGSAAHGTLAGERIVSWRAITRRSIDGDRLRRELPDVAKAYTTSSTYRTMRVL